MFCEKLGGGGGAKNVIQKSPRKGAGAEKSPNPIFIHPREKVSRSFKSVSKVNVSAERGDGLLSPELDEFPII